MGSQILGSFRHGRYPDLFLDAVGDQMNLQLTKAHEGIHRTLEYSTSNGMLLTFLVALAKQQPSGHPLFGVLQDAIDLLYRSEFHVQEGCATFLTLNMCMAGFGQERAKALQARLPDEYLFATKLFSDCLRSTQNDPSLSRYVVKNLEFLVFGIALAAMNSPICELFLDPNSMKLDRLKEYLEKEAPVLRLNKLREHLAKKRNAERYVQFCTRAVLETVGDDLNIYDQEFMRDYMSKNPVKWEEKHRHLEFEMRRELVNWLDEENIIQIDTSFQYLSSASEKWSPFRLVKTWEAELKVETGLLEAFELPSDVGVERHLAVVHSVDYSLQDKRRVLIPNRRRRLQHTLKKISKGVTDIVVRLIYLPTGNDFPDIGIRGENRLILDLALYRGTTGLDATLRIDGVAFTDLKDLISPSISVGYLISLYNYNQLCDDTRYDERDLPGITKIYVFYTPADFDIFTYMSSRPRSFELKHASSFRAVRDWGQDVELPGVIEVEETISMGKRVYFCLADNMLMGSYRKLLANHPKVKDTGSSEDDMIQRCAIEASYGFDSVLDRSSRGVYEV